MTYRVGKAAKVLLLSVSAAVMLAVSASAESEIAVGVGCTTGSSLRLREEASTEAGVVTTLDKSEAVAILGRQDGWYRISYAGMTGYVSADFLIEDQDGVFEADGTVNSDAVNIRSAASTDGEVLQVVDKGQAVKVSGFQDGWYVLTLRSGDTAYVRSDFVNLGSGSAVAGGSGGNGGIVSFAKQYLGTRYTYGGASPSGFDCSGFTMYVYSQFGVSLPHTATGQWQSSTGTKVSSMSSLQSGDLVFFCDPSRSNGKACSHAGIYIGDGQFIHASSAKSGGVVISSLYDDYYNRYYVGGKRI